MDKPLRVLIVEDSEEDLLLLVRELKKAGFDPDFERVQTADAVREALARKKWDIVISDYYMPQFNALDALAIVKEQTPDLPFIIISGAIGEDIAVEAMKAGAHDCILKDNLTRLIPAIRRELGEAEVKRSRKRAEKALLESEARYRTTLDSMGDPIFVVDKDLRIILMNTALKEWNKDMGLKTEVLGHTITGALPFLPENAIDEYEQILKNGRTLVTEDELEFGVRKMVTETRKIPILEEGRVTRIVTVIRDITERKQADEAIRMSEEHFRRLIENALEAVGIIGTDGTLFYTSPSIRRVLGYEPEDVLGKSVFELIHNDDKERAKGTVRRLSENPEMIATVEFHCQHKNRSWRIVEFSGKRLDDEENIVINYRDISERRRAEDALRDSEEKYRLLVENANDAIVIAQDNRLKFYNPKTTELSGYSSEDLADISFLDLIYPDDRAVVAERHQQRLQNLDLPNTYSFRIIKKNGEVVWAQLNVVVIEWEGRPATLAFLRDITLERQLESQLQQAQKMESIGTLAGGIAHDFNNILGGILGYASFMKAKMSEDHPFMGYVDTIEKGATRAAELTAQLLAFARGGKYDAKPVNLNKIVEETLKIISGTFDKSIEIVTRLDPGLPTIEADTVQIQQVMVNLCVNARDAMDGGGILTIESATEILAEKDCSTHIEARPGEYVTLSVIDTGAGIEKDTIDKIFEPFFTTKEDGKGTGLGLSMVYGVVKNHGGFISVHSDLGEGATFKVYLPVSGKPEIAKPSVVEELDGGNEIILVVDDEEPMRAVAKDILGTFGYSVLLAENGAEAIEIFSRRKDEIDLIILDMVMPKMGGRETFNKMKEIKPDVKALLSTGYSKDGKAKAILESGVKGFIQKPYQLSILLSKVRNVLDA